MCNIVNRKSKSLVLFSFAPPPLSPHPPAGRPRTRRKHLPPQGREFRCQGAADSVFRLFCGLDRFDYLLIVAFDLHFLPNLDYLLVGAD